MEFSIQYGAEVRDVTWHNYDDVCDPPLEEEEESGRRRREVGGGD